MKSPTNIANIASIDSGMTTSDSSDEFSHSDFMKNPVSTILKLRSPKSGLKSKQIKKSLKLGEFAESRII